MSDNEHTTVRIVDIARMAGVSVATVDRVIHNRGKVSEENLARINEVLRRVDYRPNLIARSLASGRRYTLCAVMPRFAPGEYWADFEAGIARAEAEAVRYNVTVRRFCFDQYDRSSFESLLETLRREEFDGAVIATLFAEMVEPFTRELDARGVPYVFVDSDIPACNRLAYFGTSSFDAGAVAARLLFDRLDPGADIVVGRIVHRGDAGSNQWRNREAGFRSYLEAHAFRGRDLQFDVLHPCGLSGGAAARWRAAGGLRRDPPQRGDALRGRGDGARRPASRGAGLPRGDGPVRMARRGPRSVEGQQHAHRHPAEREYTVL